MKKFVVLFLLVCLVANVQADCTKDGQFHWSTCYGLQHGAIQLGAMGIAGLLEDRLDLPEATSDVVGGIGCAGFIYHETKGQGNLFHNADRFMDWAVPCGIALDHSVKGFRVLPNGIAFWREW